MMPEMTAKERAKECMRFRYAACLSEELTKTIIDAEAAQRKPMDCGHPQACWRHTEGSREPCCQACKDVVDEKERCAKVADGLAGRYGAEIAAAIRKVSAEGEPRIYEATTYSGYTDAFEHGVAAERRRLLEESRAACGCNCHDPAMREVMKSLSEHENCGLCAAEIAKAADEDAEAVADAIRRVSPHV